MIRILKRLLFFVAFSAYLLIQVILVGIIPTYRPNRTGFVLFFGGLFLIGVCGYIVLRRITRESYNRNEADRWLTIRTRPRGTWFGAAKRWVIWMPSVTVMIVFLVFPEVWAVFSHVSHPASGRLLGYQISVPIDWVIMMDDPDTGNHKVWSLVAAFQSKGVLRAGPAAYWRHTPPIANMAFYGAPRGDSVALLSENDKIISTRSLQLGQGTIAVTCWEYVSRWSRGQQDNDVSIRCATPQTDFFGWFYGERVFVSEFYRTLKTVRRRNESASKE